METLQYVPGPRLSTRSPAMGRSGATGRCRRAIHDLQPTVVKGDSPAWLTTDSLARSTARSGYKRASAHWGIMPYGVEPNPSTTNMGGAALPSTTTVGAFGSSSLDRLAHPKHRLKSSSSTYGGAKLFGRKAILPLQSQERAKKRSQAAALRKLGHQHSDGNDQEVGKNCSEISRNWPRGWHTGSNRIGGSHRTAWDDDDSGRGSAGACKRHAIDIRYALLSCK